MNWTRFCLLLLIPLFCCISCKDKPQPEPEGPVEAKEVGPEPSKPPGLRPPGNLLPVKPWSNQEVLKFYYDREPLGEEWLKRWNLPASYKVEQKKLEPGEDGTLPLDGDLYLVSPATVAQLRSRQPWKNPKELTNYERIKPLFTGHSFDPHNEASVPWRWSPYVFYRRKNAIEEKSDPYVFSGWKTEEGTVWPLDWSLLWAMKRHYEEGSANAVVEEKEIRNIQELKVRLKDHVLPEAECWKGLTEGKIRQTLALAAWKMKEDNVEDPLLEWFIPDKGTLIQFDHLMIPAQSPYVEKVSLLAGLLLDITNQKNMPRESGYLPVLLQSREQAAEIKARLPSGLWMDQSEFLALDLEALLVKVPEPEAAEKKTDGAGPVDP